MSSSVALAAVKKHNKPIKSEPQVQYKKISRGQTVYSLLQKNKFNQKQRGLVLGQYPLPPSYTLSPGDQYEVSWNQSTGRYEISLFDRKKDWAYVFWRQGLKNAGTEIRKIKFETKVIRHTGKVRGSLIASIQKKVPNKRVAYRFLDAYIYIPKLTKKISRGAHFALAVEKKYIGKNFIRYGEITETELEIQGKIEKRVFIPFKRGGAFLALERDVFNKKPLYAPVNYVSVSSTFRRGRFHPIKRVRRAHLGVDFELAKGEKIHAAQSGKVLRKGKTRGAGNFVVIEHKGGLTSYYNHMSYIADKIKPGYQVTNGELVGFVGCTGYCTKPHLHFAVKKKGRYVDPLKFMKSYPYQKKDLIKEAYAKMSLSPQGSSRH